MVIAWVGQFTIKTGNQEEAETVDTNRNIILETGLRCMKSIAARSIG
jgi:hypothetical protein